MTSNGFRKARSLARVEKGDLCAGCGLCASMSRGAVKMAYSEEGFLRPEQMTDLDEATDRTISGVCPFIGTLGKV